MTSRAQMESDSGETGGFLGRSENTHIWLSWVQTRMKSIARLSLFICAEDPSAEGDSRNNVGTDLGGRLELRIKFSDRWLPDVHKALGSIPML